MLRQRPLVRHLLDGSGGRLCACRACRSLKPRIVPLIQFPAIPGANAPEVLRTALREQVRTLFTPTAARIWA